MEYKSQGPDTTFNYRTHKCDLNNPMIPSVEENWPSIGTCIYFNWLYIRMCCTASTATKAFKLGLFFKME